MVQLCVRRSRVIRSRSRAPPGASPQAPCGAPQHLIFPLDQVIHVRRCRSRRMAFPAAGREPGRPGDRSARAQNQAPRPLGPKSKIGLVRNPLVSASRLQSHVPTASWPEPGPPGPAASGRARPTTSGAQPARITSGAEPAPITSGAEPAPTTPGAGPRSRLSPGRAGGLDRLDNSVYCSLNRPVYSIDLGTDHGSA